MKDSQSFDTMVIGLGAMGSSTIYQLAKSGARVLGMDRFSPPHQYGSTHGDTRITRLGIGEGKEYVPLAIRSHEIWREIEAQTGVELLTQCGGLILGTPNSQGESRMSDFLKNTIDSAYEFNIEHEQLTNLEIKDRFPEFKVDNETAYYEPSAGYLRPELCVKTQLDLAQKHGARIKKNEVLVSYEDKGDQIKVISTKGVYNTRKLILSMGPWISSVLPEHKSLFKVYKQNLYWFDIKERAEYETYSNFPVFIWEFGGGETDFFYGFPALDGEAGGMKLACEQYENESDPDQVDRVVSQEEIEKMYSKYIEGHLPGLSSKCLRAVSCLYTTTPGHRFIIDYLPTNPNIIVASPCSGHGFKHSSAIGEAISQLALTEKTSLDISPFAFTI